MNDLVYRPGISPLELITPETIKKLGYFFSTSKKRLLMNLKTLN